MENNKDLKNIFRVDSDSVEDDWDADYSKIDKIHTELSRDIELFREEQKRDREEQDREERDRKEQMQHNALMKLLGIKNEAPSRPPITFRTLQKEMSDMCEKYDNESDESEKEEEK
jgi:hypothetical protein